MKGHNRLSGHTLEWEGAPHTDSGQRMSDFYGGVGGIGRGRCSCGALSEPLPSAFRRRGWHKFHKDVIRSTQAGA